MAYNHGIRISENPTSIAAPVENTTGVPIIFGTAPVNLAADPSNATNRLFLCRTFDEAKAAVGYSDDYENYTLCQCMDSFFKAFGVGPIVLCNVLDPTRHTAAYTETLTVVENQAKVTERGVILSTLQLTSGGAALVADEDYMIEFDNDGYALITVLSEGIDTIEITGNKVDPTAVTAADIIGGLDAETGVETGIELVRQGYPVYSEIPSLLLAPGWSNEVSVALTLAAKCEGINGVFKCECVVDIDTTAVTKYTDVAKYKSDNGLNSKHMICLWPKVVYGGKITDYSAVYAAMTAYTDANNDNVPNLSPSNKLLGVSATVLADGTEITLDTVQANELNSVGVVTALNLNGFRAWGNNTACYPENTDPKDRWISCRRFFSWWGNTFITTYLEKVDNPANYRLIESIVDSENIRGNALVSQDKVAGIRMEYNVSDNPIESVMAGKIRFKQYLAPYTPAEDIENVLEYDVSMVEAALGGE